MWIDLKIIYFIVFSFIFQYSYAQSTSAQDRCGYDQLINVTERNNPGYIDNINQTFEQAKHMSLSSYREDIYVIPVVVHIVYQNQSQNISQSQVYEVLKSLNDDFRHINDNASDIRPEFRDVVGDPMIHFQLKQIIRKSTNTVFEFDFQSFPEEVKHTNLGGSDAVNPKRNMNIWVCNIQGGGLQGYAYPPSCAPNWPANSSAPTIGQDGIVIDFKSFDTDISYLSQGKVIHIEGRTITHEVGHYLGLRHIWGDGDSNSCLQDDGIADTPNQGRHSDNNCNLNQNTCIDPGGNDKKDMIENYMDYSDEKCMSAFTKGQIDIMRAILKGCKSSLVDTSAIYIPDTLLTQGVLLFPNPCSGEFQVRLNFDEVSTISTSIYNELGQLLLPNSLTIESSIIYYDISNFENGVYFVYVDYGGKKGFMRKVVLMN